MGIVERYCPGLSTIFEKFSGKQLMNRSSRLSEQRRSALGMSNEGIECRFESLYSLMIHDFRKKVQLLI